MCEGEKGFLPERRLVPQSGWTPLHGAAVNGHAAVLKQLLAAGGAVDAKTPVRGGGGADRAGLGGSTQLCVFT